MQDTAIAVEKINDFLKEFFGESQIYLEVAKSPRLLTLGMCLKAEAKDSCKVS